MQQGEWFSKDNRERWAAFVKSMHPNSDPRATRLMDDFRMVAHQFYQLSEVSLESMGLSYAQYRILMSLMFCEWSGECDGLNPSEISVRQGTTRNTISALIRNLEDDGLVERLLDNDDRRRFNIHLTEAGRRKILEHASQHVQMIDELFASLNSEEIETLSSLLRTLKMRAQALKELSITNS